VASFFISHASRDNVQAERLRSWLEEQSYTSIFLDFDPEEGIPAGRQWESELYSQLRRADVLIFLGTKAATESRWCHTELAMSRSLGRTILPLRLEPSAQHPLVADRQWISVRIDAPDSLQGLQRALDRLHIDPHDTLDWESALSPYPGLEFFDENRAGVFFGRTEEIATVLEQLRRPHVEGTERLLLVGGASGSGKSSLVRAGVLPRLRRLEPGWVIAPLMTPRQAPMDELIQCLSGVFVTPHYDLSERLNREGLAAIARDALATKETWGAPSLLLVVDQAERLTQYPESDRVAFLNVVAEGLAHGPVRVLATLRSEYLSELLAGSKLEGTAAPVVSVGRLSASRVVEVIEEPARRAGIDIKGELVGRMVAETTEGQSGGDPLPLLAFTLRKLYEQRAVTTMITTEDYDRVGGVVGALKAEANRTLEQLQRQGLGDAVVPTLLELVHVDPERPPPAGRTVRRESFSPVGNRVLDAFIEARLLTSAEDEPSVSVAHEALLREWSHLANAIDGSRDRLVARTRLERDAREWENAGRDPSYLARGQRLLQAGAALDAQTGAANPVLAAYLAASRRQAHRQVWRRVALLATGLVVAGLAVGGYLLVQRLRESWAKDAAKAPLVTLPGGGVIDQHEVTNGQYRRCVSWGHCSKPAVTAGSTTFASPAPGHPVFNVDATQSAAFCSWVGRRLPTVSELRQAAASSHVVYLQHNPGGDEWTSTHPHNSRRFLRVRRIGPGKIVVNPNGFDPSLRGFDVVFRCARR
jgi:hypothetical protein